MINAAPPDTQAYGRRRRQSIMSNQWRRAKVVSDEFGQAILLPQGFLVDTDEVYLKKTPEGFEVILRDPWELFYEGAEGLSDGFMADGRQQPPPQTRTGL